MPAFVFVLRSAARRSIYVVALFSAPALHCLIGQTGKREFPKAKQRSEQLEMRSSAPDVRVASSLPLFRSRSHHPWLRVAPSTVTAISSVHLFAFVRVRRFVRDACPIAESQYLYCAPQRIDVLVFLMRSAVLLFSFLGAREARRAQNRKTCKGPLLRGSRKNVLGLVKRNGKQNMGRCR